MEFTGQYHIAAPRERVYEALNDPDVLKACIPGCEEIEKDGDTQFSAKVTAKVGPVKAKFTGTVYLEDLDPPNGYTIRGEGKGGAAGFAKGGAKVALEEAADGGTDLSYTINASVGGKLAQIGARLIDGTVRKMSDEFFANFRAQVEGPGDAPAADAAAEAAADAPPEAAAPAPTAVPEPEPAPAPTPAVEPAPAQAPAPAAQSAPAPEAAPPDKSGIPSWAWVVGVIVVLAVAILVFVG